MYRLLCGRRRRSPHRRGALPRRLRRARSARRFCGRQRRARSRDDLPRTRARWCRTSRNRGARRRKHLSRGRLLSRRRSSPRGSYGRSEWSRRTASRDRGAHGVRRRGRRRRGWQRRLRRRLRRRRGGLARSPVQQRRPDSGAFGSGFFENHRLLRGFGRRGRLLFDNRSLYHRRHFGLLGGRLMSLLGTRLRRLGRRFHENAEPLPDLVGNVLIDRAGVRLLLGDAVLGQERKDDTIRLFTFARQLVYSNFPHTSQLL